MGAELTSADGKLQLTVVADGRGRAVEVEWDMTATCPDGPGLVHLRARARVTGNAFTSNVDSAGVRQQLTGRFVSPRHAAGHAQLSFPVPIGGTCDTGVQQFTAQR